ncbi:HAMP domain-containing sensor histidine kinase [Streptomyces sp. WAC08241]|uniref:sensor histidine kinase n=1 Tax=Streptomyces sp. WAC08241 TaxID=2487421 RepID=UPI000F7704E0|nr:HAMP domain-containing sensor histidine kinase [Streptomyces sp. WAC08241]RSS37123.1 sensor histidine kinase [Streptomyces sp. WAC08241]
MPFAHARLPGLSLRWKIAALTALAAVTVAVAVGVLVHHRTYARVQDERRVDARNALENCLVAPPGSARCEDVETDPPDLPRQLREEALHSDGIVTAYDGRLGPAGDGPWMWAARSAGGEVRATKAVMNPDYRAQKSLDKNMVATSLAVLLVVIPLSAFAAGLLVRRLRRVSTTAARLSAGTLDARTGPVRGRDEVSTIAATVDTMADTLTRRIETERRFTADVAHELRTPVGGLMAAADLLPAGKTEDLLRRRIRDLRDLVEDLLEISRLDSGNEHAQRHRVPLTAVVAETVARTALPTTLTTTDDTAFVETDPRRLERIITNLVVNAHRHGHRPVEVHVERHTVTIRDHGPGYPDHILTEGPQRFRTGATERGTGHGLGLTIALAQAHVIDADLTFTNADTGGARATLRLPVRAR